jgi:hypothetical protein
MPHLIQILLPLRDNAGAPFRRETYERVRCALAERFGGLTAHMRAPAQGLWDTGADIKRDEIVVLEVMADELDRAWWRDYKRELERAFRQDEMVPSRGWLEMRVA